ALETLAIIAYRQPVTKPEIDQIRGVNSIDIINSLTEKKFVEIVGRKDALGRPLLYGTTPDFLRIFGLNTLEELPKLRELEQVETQFLEQASEFEIVVNEETINKTNEIDEPVIPTFDPTDTENIEFDDIDLEN
ncbi:MAG: SMC-Scp complex subunit ScpB, partial [FCB group bacterium]